MTQIGLFDEQNRLEKLSKLGDSLEQLEKIVDFKIFEPLLNEVIPRIDNGKGGRPPYPNLLMFKILLVKRLFQLSYDETEYQINDRISFMRFLGLTISDKVPDSKTIWFYEDILSNNESGKSLFDIFNNELEKEGYITKEGAIIDATFIEAPRRKNTKEQREEIKNGEVPEEWTETPQQLMQRDLDATWTVKSNEVHFGYKDNVKIDETTKFITDYTVTTASTNDAKGADALIDENDKVLYADAAYANMVIPDSVENMISQKANRNHPLTDEQRKNNQAKAKVRCRIEHVFGNMAKAIGGTFIRCKNILRATFEISLLNLLYNIRRTFTINRLRAAG